MCTLIVDFWQHSDAVVVAANRDELRRRPATGPRRWPGEAFVAPRDEQALGTWLGITQAGCFVGVTNRFPALRDPARRSRGQLVVDALRAGTAREVQRALAGLDPASVNPFHLLAVDQRDLVVTWSDGVELHQQTLGRGLHVVTERSLGGDDHARVELVRAHWPAQPTAPALERLLALKRPDDPTGGVCVDLPELGYGTRSAMVLFLRPRLADSQLAWADGAPDVTPFLDRSDLLRELAGDEG